MRAIFTVSALLCATVLHLNAHHGLAPLKEKEWEHLEKKIHKVISVRRNSLGAKRLSEHLKQLDPEAAAVEQEAGDEYVLMPASTEEALEMLQAGDPLPSSVNNTLLDSFPPIGDQGQIGSCVAWGSTYYHATHELGLLNGVNNKMSFNGVLSPKWTYDLLNEGVDGGLSPLDAYQLLYMNGAPSIASFPYNTNYLAWDLKTDDWVAAISNRMSQYALIPGLGGSGAQNLNAIKTALANGHVLTFATFIDSWIFTQIKSDPENIDNAHVGEYAAVYMKGTSGGHFMTIVGYDDNLWIDVNNNNQVDAGERGAFLIANSWGNSWGNNGLIWISYDAFLASSAVPGGPNTGRVPAGTYLNSSVITVVPKAANYSPTLVAEFSLTQSSRNQVSIQAGVSSISGSAPTTSVTDYALSNQGGAFEFNGAKPGTPQTATFALDLTDLAPTGMTPDPLRYYLTVSDSIKGMPTVLNSYTLFDLVHNNQISATALPKSYDHAAGSVYLDYDVVTGTAPMLIAPTVTLDSPSNGATLSGTVTVQAEASDDIGISSVELFVDATRVGLMSASMGGYTANLDTTAFKNGAHTVTVVATDTNGLTSHAQISATVSNVISLPSIYVNAGGPDVAYGGNTWVNDTPYCSVGVVRHKTGLADSNPIYGTERMGKLLYRFSIPDGDYLVTLKFAEHTVHRKHQRVFNVIINGKAAVRKLDLVAVAGFNVPYDLTLPVTVSGGEMNIHFNNVIGQAQINGIQIIPAP